MSSIMQMLSLQVNRECRILHGISKYLLPAVGHGVKKLVLAHSKGLTNGAVSSTFQHEIFFSKPHTRRRDYVISSLYRFYVDQCGS